jgi:nucleoid DNA-binding protein
MDVDLLSKMIKELILDKDRVVLPGLGCFVAEMVPSTFSDKGYTINPPYRKLSFRSKPDTGDELIDFYVEANGLDRDVACRILGDFIRELRQVIFTKKVVILPGLGRLRATKENHLFFIPEEGLDIYPAGIGLEPISLKTHVETQQEVASAVAGLKSIMDEVVTERSFADAQDDRADVQDDKADAQDGGEDIQDNAIEGVVGPTEENVVEEVATEEVVETAEEVVEAVAEEVVEVETETVEKPKKSAGKKVMTTMIVLVVLAVVLLGAFVVVARMMPGVFDTLLYTPEELEILNYKL